MVTKGSVNRALTRTGLDRELSCTRVQAGNGYLSIWLSPVLGSRTDLRRVQANADLIAGSLHGYSHVWEVRRDGRGFVIVAGQVDKAEVQAEQEQYAAAQAAEQAATEHLTTPTVADPFPLIGLDNVPLELGFGPHAILWSRARDRRRIAHLLGDPRGAVWVWNQVGMVSREQTPYGVLLSTPTVVGLKDERDGVSLAVASPAPLPTWEKSLPVLRSVLDAPHLTVRQIKSGLVELSWHDVDAFASQNFVQSTPIPYDIDTDTSILGLTSLAETAVIPWRNNSGMVVGGVPGSGKTASLLPVLAGLATHAELHIHDGKAGHDLTPLAPIARVFDRSGDLDPVLEDIENVVALMKRRVDQMPTLFGESNFWSVDAAKREAAQVFPVFVVLDECQTYLDDSGLEKDEKAVVSRIRKGVRTLIQKGRSAGIIVVLTTQKPDAQSIPTVIRDNAALRISFNVSTRQQAETVLPTIGEGDPTPLDITTAQKGRAVLEVEGRGLSAVQSWYVAPNDVTAWLQGAAPVPNQARVFGVDTPQPDTAPAAPSLVKPGPVSVPDDLFGGSDA